MTTYHVRSHSRRIPRVHQFVDGHPLCGGGNGARAVQWQQDIGPANCRACEKVALGKKSPISTPPPSVPPLHYDI